MSEQVSYERAQDTLVKMLSMHSIFYLKSGRTVCVESASHGWVHLSREDTEPGTLYVIAYDEDDNEDLAVKSDRASAIRQQRTMDVAFRALESFR